MIKEMIRNWILKPNEREFLNQNMHQYDKLQTIVDRASITDLEMPNNCLYLRDDFESKANSDYEFKRTSYMMTHTPVDNMLIDESIRAQFIALGEKPKDFKGLIHLAYPDLSATGFKHLYGKVNHIPFGVLLIEEYFQTQVEIIFCYKFEAED